MKATGKGMSEDLKSFLIRPEERRIFLLGQMGQEGQQTELQSARQAEIQAAGYYLKEYQIAEGYCCAACSVEDAFEDQIHIINQPE